MKCSVVKPFSALLERTRAEHMEAVWRRALLASSLGTVARAPGRRVADGVAHAAAAWATASDPDGIEDARYVGDGLAVVVYRGRAPLTVELGRLPGAARRRIRRLLGSAKQSPAVAMVGRQGSNTPRP